ncbi:RICIN domain-containing protein [Acrocarpospora sp. B8E8]|uniref:RICIN domain-containing protein n=1 Tax=Acrocarpospora sp. B8E8 TaxID=3153572 RepID=UPI00325C73E6
MRIGMSATLAALALAAILSAIGSTPATATGNRDRIASVLLPPMSPYRYMIKGDRFTVTTKVSPDAIRLKLWKMPSANNAFNVHGLWFFAPVPQRPGAYYLENRDGGCLDIIDGISTVIGTDLALRPCDGTRSQQWSTPYRDGRWALRNQWSGLYGAVKLPIAENKVLTQQRTGSFEELYFQMPFFSSWPSTADAYR